jgi:hypothetical protein
VAITPADVHMARVAGMTLALRAAVHLAAQQVEGVRNLFGVEPEEYVVERGRVAGKRAAGEQ